MTTGWTEVNLAGHTADVFEPPRRHEHGYVLIYLHGVHLARLTENRVVTDELARHGWPLVAPRTGRSWWTDRICAEFDPTRTAEQYVLGDVLPWIEARWGIAPPKVGLWGTSMGGQGALRLAFKHPNRFPLVAAISPAIDYQQRFYDEDEETIPAMYADPEEVRQDTATLHVHPLNWPRNLWFACDPLDDRWFDSAVKLESKLVALGIPHEKDLETSRGGHGWDYYNAQIPRAFAFLAERFERERLRVP